MNLPLEGELTKTEEHVYSFVADVGQGHVTTTKGIAEALGLDEPITAAVCDGLEAMGFIRRYGGLWHPDYTET